MSTSWKFRFISNFWLRFQVRLGHYQIGSRYVCISVVHVISILKIQSHKFIHQMSTYIFLYSFFIFIKAYILKLYESSSSLYYKPIFIFKLNPATLRLCFRFRFRQTRFIGKSEYRLNRLHNIRCMNSDERCAFGSRVTTVALQSYYFLYTHKSNTLFKF